MKWMKTTMTNLLLPWDGMDTSSRRRVALQTLHDVHWVTDINGRCGILIQLRSSFDSEVSTISLNGIEVLKRNSNHGNGELILLLNRKEDSQIFYKLCEDLISTMELFEDNDAMISALEVRLQRWQELLKKSGNYLMPIELQMGLFAELTFLKNNLFQEIGLEQSVHSWVGPDFDKQDYLLDNAVVEIKSYRTSKGEEVSISSAQQLYSGKQPLYLIAYGLTRSDNGLSILDLVVEIQEMLSTKSKLITDIFNLKIVDYGFVPELQNEPYAGFLIDTARIFKVANDFPRITPLMIPKEVTRLKYTIDLSGCKDYEVTFQSIFGEK